MNVLSDYERFRDRIADAQGGAGSIYDIARSRRQNAFEEAAKKKFQEIQQYGRPLNSFERFTTTLPVSDSPQDISDTLLNVMGSTWAGGMAGTVLDDPINAARNVLNPRLASGVVSAGLKGGKGLSAWEVVDDFPSRSPFDADDYVYHVTSEPNAKRIINEGLKPGGKPIAGRGGGYEAHSKGRVFVTDAQGVNFWRDRMEDHLFDQFDDPPDIVVLRLRKSEAGDLLPDEIGTKDAAGAPSYFSQRNIGGGGS